MKRKSIYYWLLPVLALLAGACEEGENEEGGEAASSDYGEEQFGEATPSSSAISAKDFDMSDIDALVELSLKIEGLRLEYAKMMSNGWRGELFGGPGEFTNGSKFYDYYADLLDNQEAYILALNRLAEKGVLTSPTVTRGLLLDFANWCYSLNAPNEVAFERMLTILNENHVRGSQAAMEALFRAVPDKHKCGETDARQWFVNLYAGEYKTKSMSIHEAWLTEGEGEGMGTNHLGQYYDTYDRLYNTGPGNPRWKDAHEVTKDAAVKGGQFYVDCVDEVTGGYVGKMSDLNDISEETIKLAKKIREGKATTADLKLFTAQLGSKYVKDKLGDMIGEDPGGLERLAGEITDWATNHAVDQADEEIAKGMGVNLYEIQKTTPQGLAVVLIEDAKAGSLTLGFPGKDGNTHIVTKPGDKTVTVITTEGERVTQKVPQQEPGKVVVESHPQDAKATIQLSASSVDMVASGGEAKVEIISNCKYYRYRCDKPLPEWIRVKRTGRMLTISVLGNDSEQTRTATFRAEVSFEGKVADASAIVTVTQAGSKKEEDRPKIEATPTLLTFEAEGGEQTVKVDAKTYLYYGGIADDCEDWITIKNGPNVTLIVTAAPNTTGNERTGTIYAFATNTTNPTAADIELLPITVRQKAQEEKDWDVEKVWSIEVHGSCKFELHDSPIGYTFEGIQFPWFSPKRDENVTLTKDGKGMHVRYEKEVTFSGDSGSSYEFLTFDVDDMTSEVSKVTGFEYKYNETRKNDGDMLTRPTITSIEKRLSLSKPMTLTNFGEFFRQWDLEMDDSAFSECYVTKKIQYLNGDKEEYLVEYKDKKDLSYSTTFYIKLYFD